MAVSGSRVRSVSFSTVYQVFLSELRCRRRPDVGPEGSRERAAAACVHKPERVARRRLGDNEGHLAATERNYTLQIIINYSIRCTTEHEYIQ